MESLGQHARTLGRYLAGLWLIANVSIMTIPRCDTVLAALQKTWMSQNLKGLAHQHHHEHHPHSEQAAFSDTDKSRSNGASISSDKVCECNVIKYLVFRLNSFDPHKIIGESPKALFEIQFDYMASVTDHDLDPEPPYPKTFV